MFVSASQDGDRSIIFVEGEVDIVSAEILDSALLSEISSAPTQVIVDLSGVSFMDSTGLGVIVRGLKRARESNIDFDLVLTNERVLKIFSITGLDSLIPIHDSLEAALD
ncbi:MAG: STAS domain-containing protein [Actinomycetes bacterium]